MSGADDVEVVAARGGFALDPARAEAVAAELEALRGDLDAVASLPAGPADEPATTFSPR